MTRRLPWIALLALAVGLAVHNLAMSLLWDVGVRDVSLDAVAAWKDVLLAAALIVALWSARRIPLDHWADRIALAYAAVVVVWWLLPQSWLGGEATARGELYALRHHLLPVGAYVLGRLLVLSQPQWRRLALLLTAVAVALAVWAVVDVYAVPLQWWRDSGAPGWFRFQLGLEYECASYLPENWVFNTGDEANPLRRGVSTFLSPLATAYAFVVVLMLLASRRPTRPIVVATIYCGLLWTHTRSALIALSLGLLVLAAAQRRRGPALLAVASAAVSALFLIAYPSIGPTTSYTSGELRCLRDLAAEEGGTGGALSGGEASTESHLRNLRDGVERVLEHPWGYGLGNAGVSAKRTGAPILAGESTYTELGVDAGLGGALLFMAWLAALAGGLWRRLPWVAASLVAIAAIGLQSDVIGVPWVSVVVFAVAGAGLSRPPRPDPENPA